ncbi:MAG: hypothetical protein ACO276_05070 [Ilumatobacteraceae bacterium]
MANPPRPPITTVRGLVASLTVAGGSLHLAVAPGRSADWRAEGVALAIVGVLMMAIGSTVAFRRSRRALIATSVINALVMLALVISRTAGYPFGPWTSTTPEMGAYEITVMIIAVIALALSLGALASSPDDIGEPGWRFENLAPLAVVIVALPGFVTTQWADDAAHVQGSAHTHVHTMPTSSASTTALSPDQRARLGEELASAANAVESFATLGDAKAAGWMMVGTYVPGAGQMMIDPRVNSRESSFAVDRPAGLLFASSVDSAPLVGVQYNAWTSDGSTPEGFTGQANMWHLHDGTCVSDDDTWALPLDPAVTGADCSQVGATQDDTSSWMLRVWLVRGWENPAGTFAHDHPSLG